MSDAVAVAVADCRSTKTMQSISRIADMHRQDFVQDGCIINAIKINHRRKKTYLPEFWRACRTVDEDDVVKRRATVGDRNKRNRPEIHRRQPVTYRRKHSGQTPELVSNSSSARGSYT